MYRKHIRSASVALDDPLLNTELFAYMYNAGFRYNDTTANRL